MIPSPIYWIDSFRDLSERTDLNISIFTHSQLNGYIEAFPNDSMAQNFKSRIDVFEKDIAERNYQDINEFLDIDGVREGRLAIVYAYNYLQISKRKYISNDFREDIDFHIFADNLQPFFTISFKSLFSEEFQSKLNLVLV